MMDIEQIVVVLKDAYELRRAGALTYVEFEKIKSILMKEI